MLYASSPLKLVRNVRPGMQTNLNPKSYEIARDSRVSGPHIANYRLKFANSLERLTFYSATIPRIQV
jgi:hypothetical protein